MKRIYTEQQRIEHARNCLEWMAAGKSMRSYAGVQGIFPSTLQNWIVKYRNSSLRPQDQHTDASLVRIESQTECPRVQQVQTCSLNVSIGSLVIELPAGNSDADLKRVLVTVKEVL